MELNLTLKERFVLPQILPSEGGYLEQLLIQEIKDATKVTKEEAEAIGMQHHPGGTTTWDQDKADQFDATYTFDSAKEDLLRKAARKVDEDNKVNQDNISLVGKLMK